MNKITLELEAEKFYPLKTDDLICSPKLVRDAYIAGATSEYVEKQKLEFAIQQIEPLSRKFIEAKILMENLKQKLSQL